MFIQLAANDHGLLPWRTSNLVNLRRPSGVTYFKTPRGHAEPWQQTDVTCRNILYAAVRSHIVYNCQEPFAIQETQIKDQFNFVIVI